MDKQESNKVEVSGVITEPFKYSHTVYGEKFYTSFVKSRRMSATVDIIPVTVSERTLDMEVDYSGEMVSITGTFRSHNKQMGQRRVLLLSVLVKEITFLVELPPKYDVNSIEVDGYICKPVKHRVTPLGRDVTDVLIAVNRMCNRSDYIPCIVWGRNAKYIGKLEIGTRLKLYGRIQSRSYLKRVSEEETVERTAYEASISAFEVIPDESAETAEVEEEAAQAEA